MRNRKIALLAINAKYVHSSLAPWCLAAGVAEYAAANYDTMVVETTINQSDCDIAESVISEAPDVVGISVYIWNAGKLPDILSILRKTLPDTLFILGGPEAACNAEYWLYTGADYVLCGEGEHSFPMLLDAVFGDGLLELVPGLCCREKAGENSGDIAEWINPYRDAYFDTLGGRIAYIETSRGCPFKCAFCLSGGSGVRFFPLDSAKKQIDALSKSNTQTIKFVDRTFNTDAARAYELLQYVIKLDTDCCFHFEVGADLFDERTLSLLKTAPAGRIQFEAGLQSFYEPALKAAARQTDLDKAERNIKALLSGGNIHIHTDLIAGLPYETLSEFKNSFNRAYALGAHNLQLGFLKLLHGSKLRKEAFRLGIKYTEKPPYEITESPWLSAEDLEILKHTENALRHTYNKGRFLSVLEYVLSASEFFPFSLFCLLGEAAPNHGTHLAVYAGQIYEIFKELPGIDADILKDKLVCDWLCMVKGKNMPQFLKRPDKRRKQTAQYAKEYLGRKIGRDEAAVLLSGRGVFIDGESRNPVTGLYRLYYSDC